MSAYVIGALEGARVLSRHATETAAKKSMSRARKKDPRAAIFTTDEWAQAMADRRNGAVATTLAAKNPKSQKKATLTELATAPVEDLPKEPEAPKAEAKPKANRKIGGASIRVPDEAPIVGKNLPAKSPLPGKHNASIYKLFRSSKTVGEFRKGLKDKKLFHSVQDAHFAIKLYAMARHAAE